MVFLSDIELYFSTELRTGIINLAGDEAKHALKVMRHAKGDPIFITDGNGKIFRCVIKEIKDISLAAEIEETLAYEKEFSNYFFCIPRLRNPERFEFALEKCTELGITNIIVFNATRSVARGEKKDRWEKIIISAMKQSLRAYKPDLRVINKISELNILPGEKVILDQNAAGYLEKDRFSRDINYFFIFGPEGGLDSIEIEALKNITHFKLADNRLRTETAVLKAASILTI